MAQSVAAVADSGFVANRSLAAVIAVWLALVGAGGYLIYRYETTAGATAAHGPVWPDGPGLARAADRPTLVMFAHPRCSCTAASLAELGGLLADAGVAPRVGVMFVGAAGDVEASPHWQAAGQLPGAIRLRDTAGEVRRFGARTSGQVFVYGADGALMFSGGITGSRGHVGANAGRDAAAAALRGIRGEPVHGVFGCALEDAS